MKKIWAQDYYRSLSDEELLDEISGLFLKKDRAQAITKMRKENTFYSLIARKFNMHTTVKGEKKPQADSAFSECYRSTGISPEIRQGYSFFAGEVLLLSLEGLLIVFQKRN